MKRSFPPRPLPIHVTPATRDLETAIDWFRRFEGAGLDGVIANRCRRLPARQARHAEGQARTRLRLRRRRLSLAQEAARKAVGSLLLGLFDAAGARSMSESARASRRKKRRELVEFLAPYRKDALAIIPGKIGQREAATPPRMPGGKSRWSQGKDLSWEPLRPELVVEVAYEHMQGNRFRHMAHFRRWRPDKQPADCTYAQLEVVPPQELMAIFGGDS